ncbi:L,D-transpeptidase [Rhodopseudomonas telluris]|uniref:L,D-transpeptidase family protein n=1 Tax=Rhodopseudomonas telluris TaxID=644215 RepID=A0ABV6EXW5_9BRAD
MGLKQLSFSPDTAPRSGKTELTPGTISRTAMRAGLLTAAGVFALTSEANATSWWWPDNDTAVYDTPAPPMPAKRAPRKQPHFDGRQEKLLEQQTAKPRGPLLISVSIDQQKLRVYDANGFFAESPISTGMRGHATPMGVFSVIQKNKWHRSNIYSGAPMPYMQRITWSGIALHAGVVPGYPASHGCIRMPNGFAMKMWGWTRMGARVIVTPGDITPTNFSHALLTTKRPALPETAPIASDPQKPTTTSKSDKAAAAEPTHDSPQPELRASILHEEPQAMVRTADASGDSSAGAVVSDSSHQATAAEAKAEAEATMAPAMTPQPDVTEAAASDTAEPVTTASVTKPAEAKAGNSVSTEKASSTNEKAPTIQPADKVDAATDSAAPKDQSRPMEPAVTATPELPAAKRGGGQIAVFVSAKDQKLYVRQNMTPLFDVPVTIAAGERPLGTHVFTAELAKDDSVRWTVVSLPAPRRTEDPSNSRRIKKVLPAEVKTLPEPDGPAAALDRLTVPPDAMARIAEAISTGSSLIVSDQSISASGETGQGTDFIIRLR